MSTSRLAEAQSALEGSSYAAAFTADDAVCDFQLHPIDFAGELGGIVQNAEASGRNFVGVAALTPSGPRVVLVEPLDTQQIAQLSAAYVAHVDAVFNQTLQQLGAVSWRPHSAVN